MNWAHDHLLLHLGTCTATVADIPNHYPRSLKGLLAAAVRDHAMWLQSSEGSGNRWKRRLENDRWLMMNRELYG